MYDMRSTLRNEWSANGVRKIDDVEVASYAMTPVLNAAFSYLNSRVYAELSGQKRIVPKFTASCGSPHAEAQRIMDGRPATFWSNDCFQKEGQWYCLDHGSPISINNISLVTGGPRQRDYPDCVQFEISDDGSNWKPVGAPQRGNMGIVNLSSNPVRARYVRFRIITPRPNWLSICEFSVNRTLPPYVDTNITAPNLTAYSNTSDIGINRVMEVFRMKPNDLISLELPTPIAPEWIQINMENAELTNWASVILTLESGQKVRLQPQITNNRIYIKKEDLPKGRILSMKVENTSDTEQEVKLTIFNIGIPENAFDTDTRSINDGDIATPYLCSKAALNVTMKVPSGTKELIMVGNANCQVTGATLIKRSTHVHRYQINEGTREIIITHPKQDFKFLNEVIFK
jgi:hypothetical protein